jgi:hypothetical protein
VSGSSIHRGENSVSQRCLSIPLKSTTTPKIPNMQYLARLSFFKLGRYAVASMALLHFASEFPTLFNPMLLEPIIAPPKTRFKSMGDEIPLASALRRLVSDQEVNHYISRLGQIWSVRDPETHFRNTCTLHLPVHAEIQLLNFYDNNPVRRPSFRFIGVSKKSCFLCHGFSQDIHNYSTLHLVTRSFISTGGPHPRPTRPSIDNTRIL